MQHCEFCEKPVTKHEVKKSKICTNYQLILCPDCLDLYKKDELDIDDFYPENDYGGATGFDCC